MSPSQTASFAEQRAKMQQTMHAQLTQRQKMGIRMQDVDANGNEETLRDPKEIKALVGSVLLTHATSYTCLVFQKDNHIFCGFSC